MHALGDRLAPGMLPRVLFIDEQDYVLGMTCAPPGAYPWKDALLRGTVDLAVAQQVGTLLGQMHRAAWEDVTLARQFDDLELFRQLRLEPYHQRAAQVAEARGDHALAEQLRAGASQITCHRCTLVHGDYSPKNLLVHQGGTLALDFEVAHWGNPDFDTAFLLTHLALKAIHRPASAAAFQAAANTFFESYSRALARRAPDQVVRGALQQAGCLLVARADGKSPAEYLDAAGRAAARALGARVLCGDISDYDALFKKEAHR